MSQIITICGSAMMSSKRRAWQTMEGEGGSPAPDVRGEPDVTEQDGRNSPARRAMSVQLWGQKGGGMS